MSMDIGIHEKSVVSLLVKLSKLALLVISVFVVVD